MVGFRLSRRNYRQANKRRSRIVLGVLIGAIGVLVLGSFGVVAFRAHSLVVPLEINAIGISPPATQAHPLAWPDYGQAAIATPQHGVVATHGSDQPHPTASIAKLITILAVLERRPLQLGEGGPVLTMTQADVDSYSWYISQNGSNTPVYAGLQLNQYQAVQSVLLASSNNMADTLAIWAFGSIEAYHTYASAMLEGWGLNDTVVGGDASGLSPLTTSTASDLAQVALKVLEQPVLAEIISQSQAEIPGAGMIRNTNLLLVNDEIIGMKTGETVEAGGNFVLTGVQRSGAVSQQVVVVVMGAPLASVAMPASYALFQSAVMNFSYIPIVSEGQVVARLSVPWREESVDVVASQSLDDWVWAGSSPNISFEAANSLTVSHAEIPREAVGRVVVELDSAREGSTKTLSAQLRQSIGPPSFGWKLWQTLTLSSSNY